ncbi:hypothetical protein LCGC14_2317120, partial [marine sediment metagenome]
MILEIEHDSLGNTHEGGKCLLSER